MKRTLLSGRWRARRVTLGLVFVSASVAGTGTDTHPAHAELSGCRSDPVVMLSNGVTVDLTTDVTDTAADVQQVEYTLVAPVGTSVVSVLYTSGVIGPKEVLRFYADNPANTYNSFTSVSTYTSGVTVMTTTSASNAVTLVSASATGKDQQTLPLSISI